MRGIDDRFHDGTLIRRIRQADRDRWPAAPFMPAHCMRLYCTINRQRAAFLSPIHVCRSISHRRETRCCWAGYGCPTRWLPSQ